MDIFKEYLYGELIKFRNMHESFIASGFTIDEVLKMIDEDNKRRYDEMLKAEDKAEKENLEAHPEVIEFLDRCDQCERVLTPVEATEPHIETNLMCRKHGMIKQLDITPVDYYHALYAKIKDLEIEFPPEEIRIDLNDRLERRKICEDCEWRRDKRCRKCGCSIKHRTYYEILHCPIGKW